MPTKTIRQLGADEPIPLGEPRRYLNAAGYARLRWRVGPYSYVEVYEHRFIAGRDAPSVHHRNRVKSDNSPENLAPLTALEHGAEHSRVNIQEAAELYAAGASTITLGARYGVDSSNISRSLRRRGIVLKAPDEGRRAQRPVDEHRLRDLVAAGLGVRTIARVLGETRGVVRLRMSVLGLAARRPGNYTAAEREHICHAKEHS